MIRFGYGTRVTLWLKNGKKFSAYAAVYSKNEIGEIDEIFDSIKNSFRDDASAVITLITSFTNSINFRLNDISAYKISYKKKLLIFFG